ncbi:restriction endonuclease subunit S [Vibrio sp. Sgm 5]|uniref:restriction endonuclease subunit S n=1 Tax=Vibrio sp. Sgm 5 TaxID=2994387 RepID=UPI002249668B|nr:restriction endonuclease subunit S [Vibrio sp. Sgm 5]MCX2791352.1 restriction endonuclease subunit S [Vibrio sp. Sgm 5]
MSNEKNVPEVRFEGFYNEWYCEKVANIAPLQRGFDLPKSKMKSGEYPVVMSNGINGFHNTFKSKAPGIVTGRSGTIGNLHYIESDYWPHNTSLWVTNFHGNVPLFVFYLYVKLDLKRFGSGSGVPTLNRNDVHDQHITFPKNIKEQSLVGNYFQKLDTLINQHQQKHDKFSNLKKAMLEKMFPKAGETVPEIRFDGFSGEWESKEIRELADIVRGASPRPIDDPKWFDKSSKVGWLRIRDVTEQDGRIHHLEQRISKEGESKTRVLHESHLLLSIAASVGKPVINYVSTGVHDGFLIFRQPNFDMEFMYQWLKSFESKWQQYGQPGSQVNLNSDIVKNQVVLVPCRDEQILIGDYLKKLDRLINQHKQQVTKLKNIKQACLDKMFV